LISYEEGCSLRADTIGLAAKTLRVALREGRGELKEVTAKGKVSVIQGQREGGGDEGSYVLDEEKFVLTGKAVLTDPTRGKAEGDKLTFYMGDDRILIENKSQKRSRAIIK
jgi:lipopolysaccharide export system protein LptA